MLRIASAQFWRIVDCTDDLAWALFYYAGKGLDNQLPAHLH